MAAGLRILCWNIQWGRGADGVVDLRRTAERVREADVDLLCLQEVAINHPGLRGGGAAEDQPARLADLLPGYAPIYAPSSDLPDGSGGRRCFGNMILSRCPVLQVFRHLLPWPADPARPSMPRAALEAVVEAPWGPLRVVTTHLEYFSAAQRRAQVAGLRAIHAEACSHAGTLRPDAEVDPPFRALPRPASAVFCGDFNFPPEAPEYGAMQVPSDAVPRLVDAWRAVHPGQSHAPTVGLHGAEWPDHPFCCDYFFVTPDLLPRIVAVEVIADTPVSDHQPILLELA